MEKVNICYKFNLALILLLLSNYFISCSSELNELGLIENSQGYLNLGNYPKHKNFGIEYIIPHPLENHVFNLSIRGEVELTRFKSDKLLTYRVHHSLRKEDSIKYIINDQFFSNENFKLKFLAL